jgi:hypothetical protein
MNPNYCGKMMYSESDAKKVVKKSNGSLKGVYYCSSCDAYHTTKQSQTPSRKKWFEENSKKFRNKHK